MNRPTARTPPRDPNDRQQTASSSLSDADLWGKIRAERGGCGHENLEAGHWRMPCCAARPDPDGKAWRIGRCATRQARAALALKGASLDQVSGGRFLFGVGGGWNREEIEGHGTAFATDARAHRGDEGDLDRGEAGISRRIREFSTDDDLAQAHAETISADHRRRAFPHAARRAVRYGDG
jgi:hypothetical protein